MEDEMASTEDKTVIHNPQSAVEYARKMLLLDHCPYSWVTVWQRAWL